MTTIKIEGYLFAIYNHKFNDNDNTLANNDIKKLTVTLIDRKQSRPIINQLKHTRNKYTMSITRANDINKEGLNLKVILPNGNNPLINCIWRPELLYISLPDWLNKLYKFTLKQNMYRRPDGPSHIYYTLIEISPIP